MNERNHETDKSTKGIMDTWSDGYHVKQPEISFVLENGQALIDEIKKAQQLSAELSETLENIKRYHPIFRNK
ncbi:hypothetical protein ACO2FQ_09630 [Lacticaseibacillus paracasei]|uniref:hypothetical protein n=1 Tax=Lacticaseibacillus paracasei TaxID=1597 RepID=UPI003CEAD0FC